LPLVSKESQTFSPPHSPRINLTNEKLQLPQLSSRRDSKITPKESNIRLGLLSPRESLEDISPTTSLNSEDNTASIELSKSSERLKIDNIAHNFFKGKKKSISELYNGDYVYLFFYNEVNTIFNLSKDNYLVILENNEYSWDRNTNDDKKLCL
jgi:hypothetical protein